MSVGENIRNAREAANLKQVYVAEQAGITQAMLSQIERGTKNPSLQIAAEIAMILDCSLDSLLSGGKVSVNAENNKKLQEA